MPYTSSSNSISKQKNIREFLTEQLASDKNQVLWLDSDGDKISHPVYDVDVLWDGTNYYITYRTSQDSTEVYIKDLDSVLPICIKPIATEE